MVNESEFRLPGPPTGGDAEIVRRLRRHDESAFMTLVEHHAPTMLRMASMYVPRAVAEKVVQDAWAEVLQDVGRFEGRSSLKTWIFTIFMHRLGTQAQRERRTAPFSALVDAGGNDEPAVDPGRFLNADHPLWPHCWARPPENWADSPEERLLSTEVRGQIDRAIGALPPGQREVVALRDVEGWTADEVCELFRITPSCQRVLLHRARSRVLEALTQCLVGNRR